MPTPNPELAAKLQRRNQAQQVWESQPRVSAADAVFSFQRNSDEIRVAQQVGRTTSNAPLLQEEINRRRISSSATSLQREQLLPGSAKSLSGTPGLQFGNDLQQDDENDPTSSNLLFSACMQSENTERGHAQGSPHQMNIHRSPAGAQGHLRQQSASSSSTRASTKEQERGSSYYDHPSSGSSTLGAPAQQLLRLPVVSSQQVAPNEINRNATSTTSSTDKSFLERVSGGFGSFFFGTGGEGGSASSGGNGTDRFPAGNAGTGGQHISTQQELQPTTPHQLRGPNPHDQTVFPEEYQSQSDATPPVWRPTSQNRPSSKPKPAYFVQAATSTREKKLDIDQDDIYEKYHNGEKNRSCMNRVEACDVQFFLCPPTAHGASTQDELVWTK
ncbi:unnamed protein product [Amoebophrya sp. A120]|nr:unnamed protein product [Amoebophrya sp. A120]|eukprot:GSA120T00014029001.1